MGTFQKNRSRLTRILLEYRWLVLLLLGASALLFEVIEHWGVNDPVDAHFVREILFFGIIYPVAVGLLLNFLLQVQDERNAVIRQKAWEKRLQQDMRLAANWDELVQVIVHFPQLVTPVVGISLQHYQPQDNVLKRVAESWLGDAPGESGEETAVSSSPCGIANHIPGQGLHPFTSPTLFSGMLHGSCLPLWSNDRFIGLLHLYLPATKQLSIEQIDLFNRLAPVIAQAMDMATLDNPEFLHAAAAWRERKRVARQLHDTLAQNLSYLRLKLDQLVTADSLRDNQAVYQDLERMHDIANEAYVQVRQTILALQQDSPHSLADDLLSHAQQVSERANFALHHQVQGIAMPIPPLIQHKILSIFREAMDNIQRHAQARNVDLSIKWMANHLTISLADDGLGFNPDAPVEHGRFGLLIMRRRAKEIEGRLSVQTGSGQGTRITLECPIGDFG